MRPADLLGAHLVALGRGDDHAGDATGFGVIAQVVYDRNGLRPGEHRHVDDDEEGVLGRAWFMGRVRGAIVDSSSRQTRERKRDTVGNCK